MEIAEFYERLKEHCKYNGDLDDCRACWFRKYCFTNKNEMTKEILDEALLRFTMPTEAAIAERIEEIECRYSEYTAKVRMRERHYRLLSCVAGIVATAAIMVCGILIFLLLHCI